MQQNIRGDVVRKVANHIKGCGFLIGVLSRRRQEAAQIGLQDVGVVHGHVWLVAKAKRELSRQRRVKLDAVQPGAAGRKVSRDGAMPGADLDNGMSMDLTECVRDPQARSFIDQEVLA